jgi:hypothetical protein
VHAVTSPAMSETQIIPGALPVVRARRTRPRSPVPFRRWAVLLGAVGVIAGTTMTTASAMASADSDPGNLNFRPATGALTLTPTWTTTGGCPTGYRQSAQMSLFSAHGGFLSRISPAVYAVTTAFTGTLDGTMGQIMHFAKVANGGRVEFAIGCYTQVGGTGSVKWVQTAVVTLSATGDSYTATSASSGSSGIQGSAATGSATGQQGSTSGQGQGVAATPTADSTGMSGGAEAGLITGSCAVVLAIIGFVLYRRRQDRSRLM